jgi:hypothetical protein
MLWLGAAFLLTACLTPNPDWDGMQGGTTQTTSDLTTGVSHDDGDTGTSEDTSTTTAEDELIAHVIPAAIAECIGTDPTEFGPAECEALAGAGQLLIDESVGDLGMEPMTGYLRFDVPELDGGTPVTATLYLQVAENVNDNSGQIWLVEPFTIEDLQQRAPMHRQIVGANIDRLFEVGEDLQWALDPALISEGAALHLAIVGVDSDGLTYWNNRGITPPELVVEVAS